MTSVRGRRERHYRRLSAWLVTRLEALEQRLARFSYLRLAVFLIGGIGGIALRWVSEPLSWSVLLASAVTFAVVARLHQRVEASRHKHRIRLRWVTGQIARMNRDWERLPDPLLRAEGFEHPFDIDLDLSGERSLHRLLDVTISREGRALLRDWLQRDDPDLAAARERQGRVAELIDRPGLCANLFLAFHTVSLDPLESARLRRYLGRGLPVDNLRWVLPLSAGLALLNLVLAGLYLAGIVAASAPIASFTAYALLYYFNQNSLHWLADDLVMLEDETKKVAAILVFLERYPYRPGSRLAAHCAPFTTGDDRPSRQLRTMRRNLSALGIRMNPVMAVLLNVVGPWDFFFVSRLAVRKRHLLESLDRWAPLWQELEALMSLANFGRLNPETTLPELRDEPGTDRPRLAGEGMGHPFIPEAEKVRNDLRLDAVGETVLITGSNMAGKSTFLKTLGVNLVLAYAGGPVDAVRFVVTPLRLRACIKVSDSVTDGFSYFYAEVRRLKAILAAAEEAGDRPVFFLIDEIFRGTNNRERFVGSQAYIRALVRGHALGAISTHDLDLTALAEELPRLRNLHFRESIAEGRMVFDYLLREGPCPTTNALKIMAMEGLPVE